MTGFRPRLLHLKGDVFGGFTAAIVALPLALAFGVASGAGALAGMYGAILVGFFAAVCGGTPTQISGPTGPMTVIMAAVVTHFIASPAQAFLVVVLAGLFQVAFGLAGVGRYIKLVPQPVVSGFMSGIGIIVIVLQIAPALGHQAPDGGTLVKLAAVPAMLGQTNTEALIITLLTLAIMFFTPKKIAAVLPSPLIAIVVCSIAAAAVFGNAPVIGEIPSGWPSLQVPALSAVDFPYIIRFAVVLAFLGAVDSLLTSLVADSVTGTHHNSNRELIGQGIGNCVAGLFGAIPGAGATMRTLVNIRAGGQSRVSGALHALILLALVLAFGDVASHIPLAVLAGILLKVGIDIIDWRALKRVPRAPRSGVVIMFTTLLLTVFVDLVTAVAVGIVMASVLFVARMADAQMQSAKFAFGQDQRFDLTKEEAAILHRHNGKIVLFHIEGPLSFGSARDIARMMQSSVERDILVVDFSDVPFVDSSACSALEEVIERLRARNDDVVLFGARDQVRETLQKTGVSDLLGLDHLIDTRLNALTRAEQMLALNHATTNGTPKGTNL